MVNLDRLKQDVLELAEIGRNEEDHGVYRMGFSGADMEGRRWFLKKMKKAGFSTRMDGAGNVIARWASTHRSAPSIVVGSHLDTVPGGGHLDGSLGVVVGMECLRRLQEEKRKPQYPVEVIGFADEEGRFGGMFGSQAFCGEVTPETILGSEDLEGVNLADMMRAQGMEPLDALAAKRDPKTVHRYLELHIEQGPVLDEDNLQVGIVDQITGLFRWKVQLIGKANHAGTTPMRLRKDAFQGLAEFASGIDRILEENGGERSRATIGNVNLSPGSANTVPGQASFSLDVRDTEAELLDALGDAFRKALSAIARRRHLMFEFEEVSRIEPVPCDQELVRLFHAQADRLGLPSCQMPSGAAHDAQILSHITSVGMIFVPSKGGKSHSPAEWTSWLDIEAGANLMLNSLSELITEKRKKT